MSTTRDKFNFTSVESCATFLEGLRALQIYDAETGKRSPSRDELTRSLTRALDKLDDCTRIYPDDRIPHFYYGIVLTLTNQEVYAIRVREMTDSLLAQGKLIAFREHLLRFDPSIMDLPLKIWETPLPDKRWETVRVMYGQQRKHAEPFTDLVNEEWPLLTSAAREFTLVQEKGPDELKNTAIYNLAQVHARRGDAASLNSGLDALARITPSGRRSSDEAALALQTDVLRYHLRARLVIETNRPKNDFDRAWHSLELMQGAIADSDLSTAYEIDLRADYLVKSGYVLYDQALTGYHIDSAFNSLESAASRFSDALDVRKSWNQAQLYLAVTRVIQAGVASAQEDLSEIFENFEPPQVDAEGLLQQADKLYESLLGKPAPAPEPAQRPSEAESFLKAARELFRTLQGEESSEAGAQSDAGEFPASTETATDDTEADEQSS